MPVETTVKWVYSLSESQDDDSFAARLRKLIGPKSVRAFSKEVGIGATTLQKYLAGGMPGLENLVELARKKHVSMDWLALGKGPMHADGEDPRDGERAELVPGNFTLIPRLDVNPSSGPGSLVEAEEAAEMLAFRSDWLRRMGINPRAAHILTNRGDSNEPTIRDGDVLLIDTSIDRVVDNAFYVVVFSGRTLLKRIQLRRDGSVVLSSDNRAVYQDEVVPEPEVPQLTVAGRLVWFGRSI